MKQTLRRMQVLYVLMSSVVIAGVCLLISVLVITQTNQSMKTQVSSLITADARQLELNIESYLSEVEKITTLLFSDEAYYGYDATDPSLDEYDRIQAADIIREKIVDLGLMQNFSDFGIVYADDQTVGWISQVTKADFAGGGLYETFNHVVQGNLKEQGWIYGVRGNFDRLYYAKRLNGHALIIVSFYGNELENVFTIPEELSEMTIRLTAGDDTILYSSESSEIAKKLPEDLTAMLDGRTDLSVMDDRLLVTSNQLYNGWRVVCSEPTDAVLKDNRRVQQHIWLIVLITAAAGLMLMYLVNRRLNRSMSGMVEDLSDKAEEDQMTGLLNKTAFMNAAQESLEKLDSSGTAVFMMFDLDNFKQVNDTLGHSCGDEVIRLMSRIMKKELPSQMLLGRVGGDEFGAFAAYPERNGEAVEETARVAAEKVIKTFAAEAEKTAPGLALSSSAGILMTKPGSFTANDLYQRADAALYVSKREGKSRVTLI